MSEPRCYGIVAECTLEAPLIWEQRPLTREEAHCKLREFAGRPNIIRAAIFRMDFVDGNETLVEKD